MEPLIFGSTPRLFVDDHDLADTYNTTTTVHQVRKYPGNPILRAETPGEGDSVNLLPLFWAARSFVRFTNVRRLLT